MMSEIIFEVSEDEIEGGYSASALGYGIHTEGETLEELRRNAREAVDCYLTPPMERPKVIRLLSMGSLIVDTTSMCRLPYLVGLLLQRKTHGYC